MLAAGLEPLDPYPGKNSAPWRCLCSSCGNEVTPSYANVRLGSGCAWCAGQRTDAENAREVMRAAGLEPITDYVRARDPWPCVCNICGSDVSPSFQNVKHGQRCGVCAGRVVIPATAENVMRSAGLEPLEPYPGSAEPWKCQCARCGQESSPRYQSVRRGTGCAWCAGKYVDPDFAANVMRAANFEPLTVYPGASSPWSCRCTVCHRSSGPTYSSVRNGRGCVWCVGHRVDPAEARELMQDAGFVPLCDYPGSDTPWLCSCAACGKQSRPRYWLVKNGSRCVWCAQLRIDPDEAQDVMRSAGLEPLVPFPGGKKRWKCRCLTCERVVTPTYANVSKGRRCRFCSPRGLDLTAPGLVYLLSHPTQFALKVGVTSGAAKADRVEQHTRNGWTLVRLWNVPTGDDAETIEEAVLRWWRLSLGAPPAIHREHMPQGGCSETASLLWVDLDDTVARIDMLVEQLSQTDVE